MARANPKTWLSLDRWAEICGLHPFHFNQLQSTTLVPGTACGSTWFQFSWQDADRVGREDIALAIQAAEQNIAEVVGYNLLPDWVEEERLPWPRAAVPGVYNLYGRNPAWKRQSIELNKKHILSGGSRAKTLIEAGVTFVRSDEDTDGFAETCTAKVTTSITNADEIHLYYPAKNGADAWEIRPITVSFSGGVATIVFKVWLVVAANQQDRIDPDPLDPEAAGTFETTVDVYRVYNDPQSQVQFLWENPYGNTDNCCGSSSCTACELGTQNGCFIIRDERLGIIVPAPGTWDSTDEEFDVACCWGGCRAPDQVKVNYYSGNRDFAQARPYNEIEPYWEKAIAYYAASLLERPVCGCSNHQQFIERWRSDLALATPAEGATQLTERILGNPLGTTAGAVYAYRATQHSGRKVYH